MKVFMFLALPLFYGILLTSKKKSAGVKSLPALLLGVMLAVIMCIIRMLLILESDIHVDSICKNSMNFYLYSIFFPCIFCYALASLLFRKNDDVYKADMIIPVMMGFYIIHLPYELFTHTKVFTSFELFCVPFLFMAFVMGLKYIARMFFLTNHLRFRLISVVLFFIWSYIPSLI
ncbi:MAG: hypothetical protein K6F69_08835, partial [Treponema sp.]|nr:hypothetical protein [Treponema sp.]